MPGEHESTAAALERDVLICYRGQYRPQVEVLVTELKRAGLSVSYDEPILASVGAETDRGSDADADDAWRGPLEDAVRTSELVVFVVPYVDDISDNVWDEVGWVAQSARHLFVVFDVPMDLDEEGEGLLLSTFWTRWSLKTVTVGSDGKLQFPSVPNFPYFVVSHSDRDHIDRQIRTLANRVATALDDYRNGRIEWTDRADTDLKMDDVRNSPGRQRRERVRALQAAVNEHIGLTHQASDRDPLRTTIDTLADRERKLAPSDGYLVAPDGFRYPADLERARFAQAQHIAQRMRPTGFEVPIVFATLCYEASGIELLLGETEPLAHHVLWGTLPFSELEAPVFAAPSELLFWVDRGFVDFVYQAAKASVLTWTQTDGCLRLDPRDVGEVLSQDPSPAIALVESLLRFGRDGAASSTTVGSPPPELHPPIALLTQFAERYLVAYGYLVATVRADTDAANTLAADAATLAMRTGLTYDLVDPSIGLQGCIHAEACLRLARRARGGPHAQGAQRHDDYIQLVSLMSQRCVDLYATQGGSQELAFEKVDHAAAIGSNPLVLAELAGFAVRD